MILPPEVTAAIAARATRPLVGAVLARASGRAWVRYPAGWKHIILVEHWSVAGRSGSVVVACEVGGDLGYQNIEIEARFRSRQAGGKMTDWWRPLSSDTTAFWDGTI